MTKITSLGRAEHRTLAAAMVAALKQVGDDFGVDFTAHGGTLGETVGIVKLQATLRAAPGQPSSREAEFKRWAPLCGVPADAFNLRVILKRDAYTIIGLNPNAPKNLIELERVFDKKRFKCPLATVQSQLPRKAA